MCLGVDFFCFILFLFCLSLVSSFFSLSKTSVITNVRSYSPRGSLGKVLFFFFRSVFSLLPRLSNFYFFASSWIIFLYPFIQLLSSSIEFQFWLLYFSVLKFLFVSFIASVSFLRLSGFLFVPSTFIISHWSNYSNILVISLLKSLVFFHSV